MLKLYQTTTSCAFFLKKFNVKILALKGIIEKTTVFLFFFLQKMVCMFQVSNNDIN